MKAVLPPLLASLLLVGCADLPPVSSETVSAEKIDDIRANIERLYPDASKALQHQALEMAVRAIENMVFIEGGTFEMGDFGAPCTDQVKPEWLDNVKLELSELQSMERWQWFWWVMEWSADDKGCTKDVSGWAKPSHQVTLDSYSLSRYKTTWHEFDTWYLLRGKEIFDKEFRQRKDLQKDPNHVEALRPDAGAWTQSWQQGKDHCLWLGEITGYPFDLPTEAQWEFAARNRGQPIYYATDNGKLEPGRNAPEVLVRYGNEYPSRLGVYPPTPLGLYDMETGRRQFGAEWVDGWFSYFEVEPATNPNQVTPVPIYDITGTYDLGESDPDNIVPRRMLKSGIIGRYPTFPEIEYAGQHRMIRCSIQKNTPL